jgi:transcriptional antiterminator RfaH
MQDMQQGSKRPLIAVIALPIILSSSLNDLRMAYFKAGWYLIYTKPRQERKVTNQLVESNIQAYLPLTKERRQWSDRRKIIYQPMFPSYVFVYLNNLQEFYKGLGFEGTCCYVKSGKEAVSIRDTEVNYIRMLENNGENIEVSKDFFKVGQQLIIQQGPLSGLPCEVVQYKGKRRIIVRVVMLQRSIVADLPSSAFVQCV